MCSDIVPEPPSTYYYRQVYGCFFRDRHGIDSLDKVGVDNTTFETDYPHTDSTWPNTKQVAIDLMGHLPADVHVQAGARQRDPHARPRSRRRRWCSTPRTRRRNTCCATSRSTVEHHEDGRASGRLPVVDAVLDDHGRVRAGVIATLVDAIGGGLAAYAAAPGWIATADLDLQLTGASTVDASTVDAFGRVLRAGRSTVVIAVDLAAGSAPLGTGDDDVRSAARGATRIR